METDRNRQKPGFGRARTGSSGSETPDSDGFDRIWTQIPSNIGGFDRIWTQIPRNMTENAGFGPKFQEI